jgi:hypothetical protein
MAGEPQADDVERGVRRRIRSYQREDQLLWMNPAAWTGNLDSPSAVEALKYEWVSTWASGKLLSSLAEEFERSGDPKLKADCHALVRALGGLASRDAQGRAFFPHGASPWRNGEWLHLADAGIDKGWGAELSHGYPFVTAPLVRAWECTGDQEALDLARAFADGHIAGVQPDMGDGPAFVALFKEVQRHRPAGEVEAALAEVRKLEGGFVAQPGLDDWVSYPAHPKLGTAGLYSNGIQMMGCCPPEGMRGLWEAWQGTVEDRKAGVFVNLALTRDQAVTVDWTGNAVRGVTPKGRYLPMYDGH